MTKAHIQVDPNHHYRDQGHPQSQIFNSLGFIPDFWMESKKEEPDEKITELYQFFAGWSEPKNGETVSEDGVFQYPDDPEQQPLAMYWIEDNPMKIYQYQYAIVACVVNGKLVKWTRMD